MALILSLSVVVCENRLRFRLRLRWSRVKGLGSRVLFFVPCLLSLDPCPLTLRERALIATVRAKNLSPLLKGNKSEG